MRNAWQQLQGLFDAALPLGGAERAAYLARECAGDDDLRREVESLIGAYEEDEEFLEEPALSLGMRVISSSSSEDLTGRRVGSFKILRPLGQGGMGDVYLAEDVQLGRKVALKFLSSRLADSQWAKRQFAKEAQAVAMLDHPNICAVHGFEEADGFRFIVMQYVEGRRLDELIPDGGLAPADALSRAVKIASALAAAHAHGIIHRDIKPSNIMETADGKLKVLDFGLAKLVQQRQGAAAVTGPPRSNSFQPGFIPGTISYMSPEQLRGQKLDYLTDIFSFGVVLYELLTGSNPFTRDSAAETISAVLTGKPAPLKSTGPLSRELNRVAQKCLAKEKAARYQSFSELLAELEAVQGPAAGGGRRRWYADVRAAAAAVMLLLVVTVATFAYSYMTRARTVAVLPIANETGDPSLDYVSTGMTESIIKKLTGLAGLRVKPYGTVSGYAGGRTDPRDVGRALGADAVVVGRLTNVDGALSLQSVMIDASSGSQLWGDVYKMGLAEVYRVEDDISRHLISKLELWPRSDQARSARAARATNPEAYAQAMLGHHFWRLRDKENIKKAIQHFQEAVNLDPLYAPAYAGLADCFVLMNTVHYGQMDTREAMMKAEWAAKQAVALDDTLPDTHTSLGLVHLKIHWDWQSAEREFKRAIEIDPQYAPAHYHYSNLLAVTGRFPEATAESERARDLDPFSSAARLNYCRTFYFAHDDARALPCFERLVKEDPDYKNHRYMLGLVYLSKGAHADAIEVLGKLYEEDRRMAGSALGHAYAVAGRRAEALSVLAEAERIKSGGALIPPQEFAIIYAGLGDRDKAIGFLGEAAADRFAPLASIGVDPLFDGIRHDPRFVALAKSLNLPSQPPR
ncbi:MAG TPA: protein kinase [Pyrinomonadaceae bacterium]|jgi:serine/threonine-protein kinase|nr:protein kinase [Pyrinomonadaceae bacterium]